MYASNNVIPAIVRLTMGSLRGVGVVIVLVLHTQDTLALPTATPPEDAVKLAKKSYCLAVVGTTIGSIMLFIALIDFGLKMKDRRDSHRERAAMSLPRNPVNDTSGVYAHAMLGQCISPGNDHITSGRQLEAIEPAVKRPVTASPLPLTSERPSRPQGSSAVSSG
jgi:hypothetical protein